MQKPLVLGLIAATTIASLALLAGRYAQPPQAFSFDDFEVARQAGEPLRERARRAEAAPAAAPVRVKAGELEESIQDNIVGYGVARAVKP